MATALTGSAKKYLNYFTPPALQLSTAKAYMRGVGLTYRLPWSGSGLLNNNKWLTSTQVLSFKLCAEAPCISLISPSPDGRELHIRKEDIYNANFTTKYHKQKFFRSIARPKGGDYNQCASPSVRGQLVKMLMTLKPHVIF